MPTARRASIYGLIPATINHLEERPEDFAVVPDYLTLVTYVLLPRRFLASRRQHDLPLGLRRQCRGRARPRPLSSSSTWSRAAGAGYAYVLSDPDSAAPLIGASGAGRRHRRRLSPAPPARQGLDPRSSPAFRSTSARSGCSASGSSSRSTRCSSPAPTTQVAWWAHIGGFVTGARARPLPAAPRRRRSSAAGAAAGRWPPCSAASPMSRRRRRATSTTSRPMLTGHGAADRVRRLAGGPEVADEDTCRRQAGRRLQRQGARQGGRLRHRSRQRQDGDEPVRRDRRRGGAPPEGGRQGDRGGAGLDRPGAGGRDHPHRARHGRRSRHSGQDRQPVEPLGRRQAAQGGGRRRGARARHPRQAGDRRRQQPDRPDARRPSRLAAGHLRLEARHRRRDARR